jgi:hypothetical protein
MFFKGASEPEATGSRCFLVPEWSNIVADAKLR